MSKSNNKRIASFATRFLAAEIHGIVRGAFLQQAHDFLPGGWQRKEFKLVRNKEKTPHHSYRFDLVCDGERVDFGHVRRALEEMLRDNPTMQNAAFSSGFKVEIGDQYPMTGFALTFLAKHHRLDMGEGFDIKKLLELEGMRLLTEPHSL